MTTATTAILLVLASLGKTLSVQEALSGIFGSVSLATWIFLLVPQLVLNYTTGSAEGISLAFLIVWLIGDVANLVGAVWANLVPTVIALAVYFCIADFVLISQCLYYNHLNARIAVRRASIASTQNHHQPHIHPNSDAAEAEDSPLLAQHHSQDSIGLPGSHRRRSSVRSGRSGARRDSLSKILEEDALVATGGSAFRNVASILLVIAAGTAGWVVAWRGGVWTPTPQPGEGGGDIGGEPVAWEASALGYFSAVCYLGARIPQIVKNYRDKSCDGLALLFFILSLMGNVTYGAGILFHSLDKNYLLVNLPWLIGSLGTMVEDGIIFVQFRMYAPKPGTAVIEAR